MRIFFKKEGAEMSEKLTHGTLLQLFTYFFGDKIGTAKITKFI